MECFLVTFTLVVFFVATAFGGASISSNFRPRRPSVTTFVPSTRS
jgi:hypothetical protein